MAKKKKKSSGRAVQKDFLGIRSAGRSWLQIGIEKKASGKAPGQLFLLNGSRIPSALKSELSQSEIESLKIDGDTFRVFSKPVRSLYVQKIDWKPSKQELGETWSTKGMALAGSLFQKLQKFGSDELEVLIDVDSADFAEGLLLGFDLAAYRYQKRLNNTSESWQPSLKIRIRGKAITSKSLLKISSLGSGINVARHLVNLPPNKLNPKAYIDVAQKFFSGSSIKIEVWQGAQLEKENMHLLKGVGQAAEFGSCMIHLKYRPKGSSTKKPIALVGKGITFDSGGLDLKPAQFMRWMKKDMGGSAAVFGTLVWASLSGLKQPLDVYLAVAENAVSANAFRPGDVLDSRSGQSVEIHNTDAEGRLVMADVLDVAVSQKGKDAPQAVIDVATLTGAIKASLGSQVAGLFSNSKKLRDRLFKASTETGDWCWPMPLYQQYHSQLKSPVADIVNCGDGYGGAVTAALFLEKFVKDVPWAHLDIYAFQDGPKGCLLEKGGNGQGVALLANFLSEAR